MDAMTTHTLPSAEEVEALVTRLTRLGEAARQLLGDTPREPQALRTQFDTFIRQEVPGYGFSRLWSLEVERPLTLLGALDEALQEGDQLRRLCADRHDEAERDLQLARGRSLQSLEDLRHLELLERLVVKASTIVTQITDALGGPQRVRPLLEEAVARRIEEALRLDMAEEVRREHERLEAFRRQSEEWRRAPRTRDVIVSRWTARGGRPLEGPHIEWRPAADGLSEPVLLEPEASLPARRNPLKGPSG